MFEKLKIDTVLNKKLVTKMIKYVIGYISMLILSTFLYKDIPIFAIAIFTAMYAIRMPIIIPMIFITIGVGLTSFASIIYLLIYAVLFIIFTIIIKPLLSIGNNAEKVKVGTYLVFSMIFFAFRKVDAVIYAYILFKILVKAYFVIFDNSLVFSKEDILSKYIMYQMLIFILFKFYIDNIYRLKYFANNYFELLIIPLTFSLILLIIESVKLDFLKNILVATIISIFYLNCVNEFAILIFLSVILCEILKILDLKRSIIFSAIFAATIAILNVHLLYCYYLVISLGLILKITLLKKVKAIRDNILSLDGYIERRITNKEEKIQKNDDLISMKRNIKRQIINDQEFKDLIFYDELIYMDDIIDQIFYEIYNGDIDIFRFKNILEENNIIISIEDKKIIEDFSKLKNIYLKKIDEYQKEEKK